MDTNDRIYDLAVIGAGPAGSSLIRHLMMDGTPRKVRYVLWVDGSGRLPEKPCGGLLNLDAQKKLTRDHLTIPDTVRVNPQVSYVTVWDLDQSCPRKYPKNYVNMNRLAFDAWLRQEAWLASKQSESLRLDGYEGVLHEVREETNGYRLLIRSNVDQAQKTCEETVQGDDTAGRKEEVCWREFYARCIVGAEGANSVIYRWLCQRKGKKTMLSRVAIQEWFEKEKGQAQYAAIYDSKVTPECCWSLNKKDYLIYGGAFPKEKGRAHFEEGKRRLMERRYYRFSAPIRTEACLLRAPRHFSDFETGENGAYLVGEAAGFISASSFEGISYALHSGKLLARCLLQSWHREEENPGLSERRRKALLSRHYSRVCFPIRLKLFLRIIKRHILTNVTLRHLILKSGWTAID